MKKRIDKLMVERGLAESREKAQAMIMIGGRAKIQSITSDLELEGIARERLDRVNMPIGLDIGAVLPEEIAVAIVAEIIHNRREGLGHPLSKKLHRASSR